jgi:hypothetical protein
VLSVRFYHPELAFCSIEGPDNPQALIWRRRAFSRNSSRLTQSSTVMYSVMEYPAISFQQPRMLHFDTG